MLRRTIAVASVALSGLLPAAAFSFNTSTPTQCGSFELQWDGGTPPFQFVLVPTIEVASGRILNISIPTDLKAPYSYTFDLDEPAGLEFIATMYDADGFGTGGTTPVLTVGSSSNSSCLDSPLLWDFTFEINPESDPAQCTSQTVTWLSNVTRPVNLFGMIPGGTAFTIPIPQSGTTYDWTVDIAQGTQYLLVMSDAGRYVTGGSSALMTVASGSESCMNSSSPSIGGSSGQGSATSSSAAASASVSGKGGSSSGGSSGSSGSGSSSGSSHNHTGAIVGGVIGGLALLAIITALLWLCLRRRSHERRDSTDPMIKSYGVEHAQATEKRRTRSGPMDLLGGARATRQESDENEHPIVGRTDGAEYQPSPFRYPSPTEFPLLPPIMTSEAIRPFSASFDKASPSGSSPMERQSGESGATYPTSTGSGISPGHFPSPSQYDSSVQGAEVSHAASTAEQLSAQSDVGATDAATAGHGVQRSRSTAKPAHINTWSPGGSSTPVQQAAVSTPTRYVQHEDSGEIVDLPPRYDQLRTRNPDQ